MTSRRLIGCAVATLALSGAAVALAGVSETVPTTLKMRNSPPAFHGKVKTGVPDCDADRRVKLFYVSDPKGTFGGTGRLIGRTDSNARGRWFIDATPLIDGGYYAKVKQHIVNIDGVLVRCEPAFSRGILVGPD